MDNAEFEEILKREGLLHLKNDMEKLREELLKRLGLTELKDSPDELFLAMLDLLKKNSDQLKGTKLDLGKTIIEALGRNN
ncbi:MAG: hypothetical protein JSV21_03580 [Nitrospirota bacterium]|nr:MAG: hypothetical protein JSV21_03580 [Nitrospirota bacterium]